MALESQQRVIMVHAAAVIGHADHALAARFDLDANRVRARIEGVFKQLLHHRRGTLDHLAGRDSVRDVLRQYPYLRHELLRFLPDCDAQFVELILVDLRRRLRHQIHGRCCLGKRDDLADGFSARQEHGYAVKSERDPAVRRRAVGERIEEKPEALPGLLVAQTQGLEHPRLHVLTVDSNASRAELITIEDQVIALGPALPRRRFELIEVLFVNSCKRMLRADPALFSFAPLKKREAGDPRKFPLAAIDQLESVTQMEANLPGDMQGG